MHDECKKMLQEQVNDVVVELNAMMEALDYDYDEEKQEFIVSNTSEIERGVLLIGKKTCLHEMSNKYNHSLDWSKLDDRFDELDYAVMGEC